MSASASTPGKLELSAEWLEWLAENLLRGASHEQLIEQLTKQGIPAEVAHVAIRAIQRSPIFVAAQRQSAAEAQRELARHKAQRRAEQVLRLLLTQQQLAGSGTEPVRVSCPPRAALVQRFISSNTPAIFTDLVTRWPGFGKWNPPHFRERFGACKLSVATGRESDPNYDQNTQELSKEMAVADFVDLIDSNDSSNDFYMVARHRNLDRPELAPLFDELWFPEGWLDPARFRRACALWFGPKGTITPLHHDTSNILFCQVYGRKQFILASPLNTGLAEGANQMYANFDPESEAGEPRLKGVATQRFVLEPGEALLIPAGYWHHVRSLDVSISVAVNNFTFANNYDWYRPGNV